MMSDSEEELSFASVEEADEAKISDIAKLEDVTVDTDDQPAVTDTSTSQTAVTAERVPRRSEEQTTAPAEASVSSEDVHGNTPTTTATAASNTATSKTKTLTEYQADPARTLDKLTDDDTNKAGWGWGNWSSWGSSVLNTAASSVGTFTSQVGEGLYQVLETVESGLLAADGNGDVLQQSDQDITADSDVKDSKTVVSQKMVRRGSVDETVSSDTEGGSRGDGENVSDEDAVVGLETTGDGWLTGWKLPVLSDVVNKTSSVVQQTVQQTSNVSMKVLGGGIDVLEAIGRKTYDVLAEGEHGLKKTIVKSREGRPTLSQTLREAKMLSESREQEEEAFVESRKANFGAQFDDFQGLVQLEALEILSSSSEHKVRRFVEMLPRDAAESLKSELLDMRQIFNDVHAGSDDDDVVEHDFNQLVTDYYGRLNLNAGVQKLLSCQTKVRQVFSSLDSSSEQHDSTDRKTSKDIHQVAIQSLAEMTACATEHWHRVGQQMLLVALPQQSYHDIAHQLAGVCKVLCTEISLQSAAFVNCLTTKTDDEADTVASELITSVYLESSNASDYIRNGLSLLLPVLQLAVIKAHPLFSDTSDD